jgi:hypothetical protein
MGSQQNIEQAGSNSLASIFGGVSTIGRKAQAIAGELGKLSEENLGAGTKAAEKLRDAKSLQDVTSIQSDLLKESFETTNGHFRKIAEIAASTPQEVAKSYQEFLSAITEIGTAAAHKAGDLTRQMGEKTSNAANQAADVTHDAAEMARDNVRQAVRY